MTLTLHKSQVHYTGVMHAVMGLQFTPLFSCKSRSPNWWSMCDPVAFAHLQCVLETRNLDGTNLGSCWCRRRARRIGQRELSLPCAWKSPICVACLVFSFLLVL